MTTSGIYPIDVVIGGERITVASAAPSGGNLVLSGCTRHVNGIVKTHGAGEVVTLANPFRPTLGNAQGVTGRIVYPPVNFTTTAALVSARFAPNDLVLAWMPNNVTATSKNDADWELGQYSTFTNADTSPSYGFWYPNTASGGAAYANANYNFVADQAQAFSGTGYARLVLDNPYTTSYACQLWRTVDQQGASFPHTFYASWRVRYHQVISYDNYYAPYWGFINQFQVYRTHPVNSPFVTIGAGKKVGVDANMRWYVNLDNRVNYDLAQISPPTVPINQWVHMEMYCVISDGYSDGRQGKLRFWQDGTLFLDYAGPTIADYWEAIGMSWGVYGTLNAPQVQTVDYDECLVSTAATVPYLVLPQPAGGLGS
jgi:hypothetical protein